jgi:diacylglycerol kinase
MSSERKVVEKSKKLINSFKYAIQGILSSFKTERNMKIHIFVMILVIIAGVILKINKYEWIACILCFAIVISGELFNTAIETVVDMVMPYKNDKAKIAKDIAAGAVLTLAIGAAVIGVIIFVPKIF